MEDIEKRAERNARKAWQVVRDLDIQGAWESIGAEVHLVGSLKTGLFAKHRDIDFHIYTPGLRPADSFAAVARLAGNAAVERVEYRNLIDTEEACMEWHAWYRDEEKELWQIDMIHIRKGSTFDGFFERVAERIEAALTPEARRAILQLKFDTPDGEKIMGIEYYKAVLRDGIRTYADFTEWRKSNPPEGIDLWMP